MSRSTATYIDYDLRPAKQAERRMILDLLECMKEAGLPVSGYRYIGMGGIKFYDFAMIFRYLGITDLISFERHKKTAVRSEYNKPFALIKVRDEPIGNYLRDELEQKETICWLDYDNALNDSIMDDIRRAGMHIPPGSAVFLTVTAEMPRDYLEMNDEERLAAFLEEFGDFAGRVTPDDMQEAAFSKAWHEVVHAAFTNAFATRDDGEFLPVFRIDYKDSTRMLTYGGPFLKGSNKRSFLKSLRRRLPFLFRSPDLPYAIRTMNTTDRERHLLEFSASGRKNSSQANTLLALGYKEADLAAYRDLVRFLPRYVETLI